MTHKHLLSIVKRLPEDYSDYGGNIKRWEDPNKNYPDCSCGCKYALPLSGEFKYDWVVCANHKSHRCGLLTFEHQGCLNFESDPNE